eukprot:5827296-Prymnesium_polylepis.1
MVPVTWLDGLWKLVVSGLASFSRRAQEVEIVQGWAKRCVTSFGGDQTSFAQLLWLCTLQLLSSSGQIATVMAHSTVK